MTNKILYVDDVATEVRFLKDNLGSNPPILFWVPNLFQASQFLNAGVYECDLVLVDINGTSIDFKKELSLIKHHRVVITSGIFDILGNEREFVLKKDLPFWIKKFYSKG